MSALSTPSGGGTTAQSKPTSGKQKFQKLDINSLYCANRNESSEPSLAKSQLSRKHGMQSLGKVPSARRPPANLPSLRTETGQDPNANSVSTVTTTVSTPATCTSQTITTVSNSGVVAGTGSAGWVPLPPPSSPHFRTEFPSLEAAAQPSHRASDHSVPQPQLRPQTEGSWTCGGTAGVRPETTSSPVAAPASSPASQQTPAYRAILPSFLMKGSSGTGLGLGTLSSLTRDNRNNASSGSSNPNNAPGPRQAPRVPATPRAVEVLTARPILREEEISSLDDISRDAGWAQHDDIDYDQKLDFSDGETSTPTTKVGNKNNNRSSIDNERMDSKIQDPDEEQLWAERRQKQSNEVAQAVARARQRKEEEQRRQMRDPRDSPAAQPPKDSRDKAERNDRERIDNRERDFDVREKDRIDNRDKDRSENKDKERNDFRERDARDKDRLDNRERDRLDRFDNRDRDREREKERPIDNKDRPRSDNRDRSDSEKDRDMRDRDRNDNRDRNDRDRSDRDRYDRERERNDRDGRDRGERERGDRDRDFRDRDRERDYVRDREQPTPFSKTFQQNIPPRFMKQQQNRQQDDQHKAWSFTGKPRRQEPPQYNAPRHNASHNNNRRSYSRDYSDREDDVRRDRDGPGPQWRSEMQDYDRPGRDLDRSNSKDSYKDFNEYKDRRNDPEKKSIDTAIEHSSRTAADKLTEVFERKSIGLTEPFSSVDSSTQPQVPERRTTPPSHSVQSQRESFEKDFSKTSWAEVTQEEQSHSIAVKLPSEKDGSLKQSEHQNNEPINKEKPDIITSQQNVSNVHVNLKAQNQSNNYHNTHTMSNAQPVSHQQTNVTSSQNNIQIPISSANQSQSSIFTDSHSIPKSIINQSPPKSVSNELLSNSEIHKQPILATNQPTTQPTITVQKSEKELSESESIASKSSTDPSAISGNNQTDSHSVENIQDSQKRFLDDKKNERFNVEHMNKIPVKEPVERKSSGSGSEKKGRGYGSGGYNVYGRGWGSRESRGRRSHRSSRSNNRASESDGSTDGTNLECKERRKAPRSPRGLKKQDRPDDINQAAIEQGAQISDGLENREPFAPRGQPSRRGRGGFQGSNRPPAPAKRLAGYGLPNTKRPFSQANRAIKDHEDNKDGLQDDKDCKGNKSRTGSSSRKGRDRRTRGVAGPNSGEDENWETTSEHSESGGAGAHHRSGGGRQSAQSLKGQSSSRNQNCNNRQNNRSQQAAKKEGDRDKNTDITEAISDLKISTAKKDEEVVDDGFQEVRNKKNSKETRGPTNVKDEKQPRSRSNQGGGRNGSSTRSSNDKSITRGSAPVSGKPTSQYDRPRQANLAPRFVKQRQKQQMGLISSFGPDISAAPPPPPVNAWDKPISQTLRGNVEEPPEVVDTKSSQSSQRSTPGDTSIEIKPAATPCALVSDKTGVLDGTTPPVETIIFENTNYKTTPPAEALKQKYQPSAATAKPQGEEVQTEMEARPLAFNGDMRDVRPRPRSIQEIMAESGRPVSEAEGSLGLQMSFDASQKAEESDMKLDFAFDSDLGQLTEDKSAKTLGLPRGTHMSTSNTISAADLNFKIASVKKVWEMPAVVEGGEELQFAGLEETNTETGAPPNVCKVKPTQQLQSPPPSHYNHVSYQGGYGGLSVPSPPAVLFNSTQPIINSSQQLQQQGGLYGAFLDQTRTQFGGFPGTPYGAGSATPYNYQPPPDMFQSLQSQYRMGPAGSGAAFGQSAQLGNSPSTVLISSTTNSHMSTVKPSTQQIGAIGSKGGGVGGVGVGGVGGVNTFQQQYLGYSGPEQYSLTGLLPRPAPPATSYYSPYQPPAAQAPTYPLQFTQPAVQQSSAFSSQFLSTQQLHAAAAAAVQQMQQQYRAPPLQTQYAPPQPRPPPQQQLKSPLHEHANGFAPLCDSGSPTPKGASKPQKPPHSPPHKYHAPPPHQQHVQHPPPSHTPHQHHQQHQHQHVQHQQHQQHQQQMVGGGNNGRGNGAGGNGNAMSRGGMVAPRYPAPIQRPHAPALPLFRAPPAPAPRAHHAHQAHQAPRAHLYYHHHQRNGGGGPERVSEGVEAAVSAEEAGDSAPAPDAPAVAEVKAE